MACIFCGGTEDIDSIEHIVPESLGNIYYTLDIGSICGTCNNIFSKFENEVLSKSILGMERARLAAKTKKGKPAHSKTGEIAFTGDGQFRPNYINIDGLKEQEIQNFDRSTGTFSFIVQSFDKNETAVAKLLLKMGIEGVYQSKRGIYQSYNFSQSKAYLLGKGSSDWPFIINKQGVYDYKDLLKKNQVAAKHLYNNFSCKLLMRGLSPAILLFRFKYGAVNLTVNLINPNISWIVPYEKRGYVEGIYPLHFERKLKAKATKL